LIRYIRWIVEHADIPRVRPGGIDRVNLKVFPHYVAYLRIGRGALDSGHRPWAHMEPNTD